MAYLVGVALALFIGGAASLLGMDRDRAFYPAVLLVVASYYVLFAVIDGSGTLLLCEIAIGAVFAGAAVVGFKRGLWLVAVGLVAHGVLDVLHPALVHNTGVPPGWREFCMAFDVTAGVVLGWLLARRSGGAMRPAASRGR